MRIVSARSAQLVLSVVTDEPCTPNEIAAKAKVNQKTAQTVLLELLHENKQIRMKKIGRYRIFWKVSGNKR